MRRLQNRTSLFAAGMILVLATGDYSGAKTFALVIQDLFAAASPLLVGTTTTITVDASDSGPLAYVWSTSGGTISGSGTSVTWQAPGTAGSYTVTCTVTGPSGTLSQTIQVAVVAGGTQWPSTPPAGCPFPPSAQIPGILFGGPFASQHFCDTWYPSWGADGALYTPWMDGLLLTPGFTSDIIGSANGAASPAQTGWAKILGDDPTNLEVVDAGLISSSPAPYGGRYASASLNYNGTWFYGTYTVMNVNGSLAATVTVGGTNYNWGVVGPFVGFHVSTDGGHTWTPPSQTPSSPLFNDPATFGGTVKFAVPHFVDFGKNMQYSPDGKAYLTCHGAVDPDSEPRLANDSWCTGDQIYMARVTPSASTINDPTQYEFFAGNDAGGKATWTSSLAQAQPIISWNNHLGCVSMTWFPPLNRYLTCITDGQTTADTMNTIILESPTLTGPFGLVTFMTSFGEQAYFSNFPSKFIAADGGSCWMWYSANFMPLTRTSNPPGSGYHLCSRQALIQRPVHSNPVSGSGGGSLPAPWQDLDIGGPSPAGSASFLSGTFTLSGSGGDIWNASDSFNYVYQPLVGDGEITARITGIMNTDSWAKAGVMIRESLNADSANALVAVTPGNGVTFQSRATTGGGSSFAAVPSITAPCWVKLVRTGSTFAGYESADGNAWNPIGTPVTIPMTANPVYIGLAVTSHNASVLNTATADSVGGSGGWTPPAAGAGRGSSPMATSGGGSSGGCGATGLEFGLWFALLSLIRWVGRAR